MAGHRQQAHFPDQASENLQRLRQYDAAVASDSKQNNFDERMDFQRQKEAFDQAFKTSEAERKASQFEATSNIRGEQVSLLQQRLQLSQEVARHNEMLKEQAQITKDRATLSRQKAGLEFYKGINELDPQSPDFRSKFGDLMGKVQSNLVDSEGKIPEDVVKAADHLWSQHNTWAATNLKQQAQGNGNTTDALQDALAASQPVYGVADTKGQNFNATQAGKDEQTHVQTTYLPPGSKKPVTQVFPRSVFDSMVAASVARNQVTPPATPSTPAAPTAPTIPAATPDTAVPPASADTAAPAPIRMKFQDGKLVPVQ